MRSCVSALAVAALLASGATLDAQAPGAAAAYQKLQQREAVLRADLDAAAPKPSRTTFLKRLRTMSADYEDMSKTYPTSGYSDNALWQAAMLSADAFWQFGEAFDKRMARHLFDDLRARFPSSSLIARATPVRARLDGAPAPAATRPAVARSAPSAPEPANTLVSIQRDILADAVRITLALEQETTFSSQRLDNPSRLAIDLRNTRVVYALKDARLKYPDDVVRQVRIDRTDARTRVLLDLERAGRFSVYPMYDPYRLVIDVERAATRGAKAPAAVATNRATPPVVTPAAPTSAPVTTSGAKGAPKATPAPATTRQATKPPAPATESGRGGYSLSRQLGLGAARVVIDPGHGGHDPGAQVQGLDEADLVLDVALKLEQLLLRVPGVEVVMTRRTSEYIPLEERTAIANRAGADLFLSIHANASPNAAARGIETYFLNFAPNAEAEAIAARENAGSNKTMRNLTDIVRAITMNDKIDESRDFAMRVQSSLYARLRKSNKQAKSLGVKQAPFQVLIGATMPSVLAEISFLTNEEEAGLLKTDAYRAHIAAALFDGVMGYQQSLKTEKVVAEK